MKRFIRLFNLEQVHHGAVEQTNYLQSSTIIASSLSGGSFTDRSCTGAFKTQSTLKRNLKRAFVQAIILLIDDNILRGVYHSYNTSVE